MPHQCTDCGRAFDDGSKEMLSGCPDCGGNTFQFRPADTGGDDAGAAAGGSTGAGDDDILVADDSPPEPPEPAVDSTVARTVGKAATTVRDFVGSRDDPGRGAPTEPELDEDPAAALERDSGRTDAARAAGSDGARPEGAHADETSSDVASSDVASREDTAQASARSDVVSRGDLPPTPEHPATVDGADDSGTAAAAGTAGPDGGTERFQDPVERPDLADLREELNEQFESIKVLEPGQYELNLMELYDREAYIIALQEDGKYTIQVPDRWQDG
jgi:predicted  nucleic acid-binding Zn-ribbon protein